MPPSLLKPSKTIEQELSKPNMKFILSCFLVLAIFTLLTISLRLPHPGPASTSLENLPQRAKRAEAQSTTSNPSPSSSTRNTRTEILAARRGIQRRSRDLTNCQVAAICIAGGGGAVGVLIMAFVLFKS